MTGMNGAASLITVATCNLNQWALDFDGNLERIYQSCQIAKERGATYRLGPELEICGYGCEDHFLEPDTFSHCWESLATLFQRGATDNLLCDFGMPLLHGGVRYNCRLVCYNRRILTVRPKRSMADNGNYRESRYFTAYRGSPSTSASTDEIILPLEFSKLFGQRSAPFGTHYLQFGDGVSVGCESCEELWTPQATHIDLALRGVEIIGNGSGSHHELRKLQQRLELMVAATRKCGGVYLYSNQRGCDGGRLYYDGCAMIVCNGNVLAQAKQFDLDDVEVITATIDLEDVRSYRASIPSFGIQATEVQHVHPGAIQTIHCPELYLLRDVNSTKVLPATTKPQTELRLHTPEEECCLGPACWLWDYLRRSGASGYFLPLSGGADSSSVATIVGAMCHLATSYAQANPTGQVAHDCRRLCGHIPAPATKSAEDNVAADASDDTEPWVPRDSQELAKYIFHTTFMGTDNSSENTTSRARRLGESIGSYHLSIKIDLMVEAVIKVFALATGRTPHFALHGGAWAEDVALQNIQARLRMVTAYLLAQLLPWVRGLGSGFLLVLGSANVDEGLRGYLTKYDCSSADLNPIGAISKTDLKKMLLWASDKYQWPVLTEIAEAPPTAELRPMVSQSGDSRNDAEHSQLDEEEMGMTYAELSLFGTLRKISRCGPVTMFRKLCETWSHLQPSVVAEKVKRFFYFYAVNRHKMCTITPAYHAEAYSPDDNRFDLRQFLYNVRWPRQFSVIDNIAAKAEQSTDRNDDEIAIK